MEIIILLILLFFCFGAVGIVAVGIVMIARWVSKPEPPPRVVERAESDLAVFERQLVRFYTEGKISDEVYDLLMMRVRAERRPTATDVTDRTEKKEQVVEKIVFEKVVVESVSSVAPPPPAPRPRVPRRPF